MRRKYTRTENVLNALGYQGGTVHDLCKDLNIDVQDFLYKKLDSYEDTRDYCRSFIKEMKHAGDVNLDFWISLGEYGIGYYEADTVTFNLDLAEAFGTRTLYMFQGEIVVSKYDEDCEEQSWCVEGDILVWDNSVGDFVVGDWRTIPKFYEMIQDLLYKEFGYNSTLKTLPENFKV